jgi:hypothetical protein
MREITENINGKAAICGYYVSGYWNDASLSEYKYNGVYAWKNDGERFINDNFIDEYSRNCVPFVLNDGRPELPL